MIPAFLKSAATCAKYTHGRGSVREGTVLPIPSSQTVARYAIEIPRRTTRFHDRAIAPGGRLASASFERGGDELRSSLAFSRSRGSGRSPEGSRRRRFAFATAPTPTAGLALSSIAPSPNRGGTF